MAVDADSVLVERRLRRGLFVWRVVAILALVALAVALYGRFAGFDAGGHIARLKVAGIIVADSRRDDLLVSLAADSKVKALIVRIDSPGGTVVGGESLFRALRNFAEKKPVVAVMSQVATSAAYMIALATDRILAHEGSITGSIGVLFQTTDVTGLLNKLGVSAEAIKSAPLKASPSPLEPLTPAGRAAAQAVVDDIFDMFRDMVASRRNLSAEEVNAVSDGRVFTGRQALKHKLIDEIGGEDEAIQWLQENRDIAADLPVQNAGPRKNVGDWLDRLVGLAGKTVFSERLTLDGLVSVWHPGL